MTVVVNFFCTLSARFYNFDEEANKLFWRRGEMEMGNFKWKHNNFAVFSHIFLFIILFSTIISYKF